MFSGSLSLQCPVGAGGCIGVCWPVGARDQTLIIRGAVSRSILENPTGDTDYSMTFQPGDIAACYGVDWTSSLIRLFTSWPIAPQRLKLGPSHVAILCEFRGEMIWVESTTLCRTPCRIRQQRTAGVQAHLPEDRIADYVGPGGRVDLYRLTSLNQLSSNEAETLQSLLIQDLLLQNVQYNLSGALLSGTRILQLTGLLPSAQLHQLFCSELIAAVLMRLGLLNRSNPTRFNPSRLLRELVRTGAYRRELSIGRSLP